MRLPIAFTGLLLLAGCAALAHHADDSYLHTRAQANSGDPNAQLDLARMYADPAAWPQMHGRPADPVRAAKWCVIFGSQRNAANPDTLARGPSCQKILASLPPDAVNRGTGLALDYFTNNAMYSL